MNGLKYIRTRCNMSLNDLAQMLGITRQALSSWENERKDIPVARKQQLAEFFGIDATYFGDITEEEKQNLLEKAMFRYEKDGKETYRYKPQEKNSSDYVEIVFLEDAEYSVDEKFIMAQKKQRNIMQEIDKIMEYSKDSMSIQSKITCINRGCNVYGALNDIMHQMKEQKILLRMPYYGEVLDILNAMLYSQELIKDEDLKAKKDEHLFEQEDVEWIKTLAKVLKDHWNERRKVYDKYDRDYRKYRKENPIKNENVSLEEQSKNAEIQNKEFREKEDKDNKSSFVVLAK